MIDRMRPAALALVLAVTLGSGASTPFERMTDRVELVRVPNGGIQPELAVDAAGAIHLVYLAGEPGAADVYYVRSADGGRSFSPAVRVNTQPGSAIATGTIRGASIALGRKGRVHVAWNGSATALPQPLVDPRTSRAGMPMLYARSDAQRTGFEPQRNLMTHTINLDGGGSIAADERGGVYVAWHGNTIGGDEGEQARRVWIARSTDDGTTFDGEMPVSDPSTGACGCCALRLAAGAGGALHLLYRSARGKVHRDLYSLVSRDRGATFEGGRVHAWEIGVCPMTSMAIVPRVPVLRAWETDGQVYFDRAVANAEPRAPAIEPGTAPHRKHPRLAVNAAGTVLMVWADGTAWSRGGSVGWQAFSPEGRPTAVAGKQAGLPTWSFAAVAARPDGSFVVFY